MLKNLVPEDTCIAWCKSRSRLVELVKLASIHHRGNNLACCDFFATPAVRHDTEWLPHVAAATGELDFL
jgi:hypothetical protein